MNEPLIFSPHPRSLGATAGALFEDDRPQYGRMPGHRTEDEKSRTEGAHRRKNISCFFFLFHEEEIFH